MYYDANYIYTTDDLVFNLIKVDNILTSPVDQWIPKLDVEFGSVANAIDEVLDYSGAIVTVNFADDQLVLYDPEQVTSATGIFIVTNTTNKLSDDANMTMYPDQPYSYEIFNDSDESANRLILAYKDPNSHLKEMHQGEKEYFSTWLGAPWQPGFSTWNPALDIDRIWGWQVSIPQAGSPVYSEWVL